MLRFALRPRWLALLALALLLATAFSFLGNWQLSRSRQDAPRDEVPTAHSLSDVLAPQTELDGKAARTPVIVTGTVDTTHPVTLVTGRVLNGRPVRWVVVPVLVDGGPARLPVVLGVIDDGAPTPDATPATVQFEAYLQAGDEPQPATGDNTMGGVDLTHLLNRWGPPMYAGYVFADQPTADAVAGGIRALPAQPPAPPGPRFAILNLSYALQWWVFAAFAVFIWWRMLRDSYLKERQDADGHDPGAAPPDGPRDEPPPPETPTPDPRAQPSPDPRAQPSPDPPTRPMLDRTPDPNHRAERPVP